MMILEKLVGGLIGKNGYNITKIRTESGATIKVIVSVEAFVCLMLIFLFDPSKISCSITILESHLGSMFQSDGQ